MARTARTAAAALAAAALGLAAGAAPPEPAEPLGEEFGGSVATLADCAAWRGGTKDRKLATIEAIRNLVSRDDTAVDSPPLSDEEAMKLFDAECAHSYASSFRLYVIYTRAAGYAPLLRDG